MRHLRITQAGAGGTVELDGHDISNLIMAATVTLQAGHFPIAHLEAIPDDLAISITTDHLTGAPLDGIERLRSWVAEHGR